MRPPRFKRVFALFWAVVQFALPMGVLWGDAFEARASVGRDQSHVEATTTANCRLAHADDCALCRFLSNSSVAVSRATPEVVAARSIIAPAVEPTDLLGCSVSGLPPSRAPPAA